MTSKPPSAFSSASAQGPRWVYASVGGLLLFALIAFLVQRGIAQPVDDGILRSVHDLASRANRPGHLWGEESVIAITSLGTLVILVCACATVLGLLLLTRQWQPCVFILIALLGGIGLNQCLKPLFARGRPAVVPHAQYVDTASFPSGHALISTSVYLALGLVAVDLLRDRRLKRYLLAITLAALFFIGLSRVYLGVHHPTDVLAGWIIGAVWVALSRKISQLLAVGADTVFGEK